MFVDLLAIRCYIELFAKARDLPDHTSCIYLSFQMHDQDYQERTMMLLGLLIAQPGDACCVITLQKQIGCVTEWLPSEPQVFSM